MRQKKLWPAVLLALAVVAAACGGGAEPATTQAPGDTTAPATTAAPGTTAAPAGPKTIIIGTTDSIAGLDSADAYAVHDWELIRNTGQGLMTWEPGTANLIPGIAESFDVSDDGTTYTFHLRSDVAFYDGTPLTAEDYVAHLNRMLNLDGDGGVGGALGKPYILCTEQLEVGCASWGVSAPDSSTVVIQLQGSFGYFPELVTGAPYMPMHPSYSADALVEFPVAPFGGVGAWMVTEYTVGEQTVLEPNPNWYGDPPKVDRIIITYFTEASQLVQALQAGDIDIAWRSVTEPALLDALAGTSGVVSAEVPGGGIRYFIMNHNQTPTDDKNVRQAIAAALDRTEIIERAFGGNAQELYSPIPPGFLGANEVFDQIYGSPNIEMAQQLLAESGFTADSPLELEVNYPPNRYGGVVGDAMQVVKEQLEATGAITVNLVATEWATYLGNVIAGDTYGMSFLGWFFDYPDSSNYVEPFTLFGGLGTNVTVADTNAPAPGLSTPELIGLIQQAGSTTDSGERADLYEQIQALYADDVVTIPLWFEPERVFYQDYITADAGAAAAESLNIGPTIELQYRLLDTSK